MAQEGLYFFTSSFCAFLSSVRVDLQRRPQHDVQLRLRADDAWPVPRHHQLRRSRDPQESVRRWSERPVRWSVKSHGVWAGSREDRSYGQPQDLLRRTHSQYVISLCCLTYFRFIRKETISFCFSWIAFVSRGFQHYPVCKYGIVYLSFLFTSWRCNAWSFCLSVDYTLKSL